MNDEIKRALNNVPAPDEVRKQAARDRLLTMQRTDNQTASREALRQRSQPRRLSLGVVGAAAALLLIAGLWIVLRPLSKGGIGAQPVAPLTEDDYRTNPNFTRLHPSILNSDYPAPLLTASTLPEGVTFDEVREGVTVVYACDDGGSITITHSMEGTLYQRYDEFRTPDGIRQRVRGLTAYVTDADGLIWNEGQVVELNKTGCEGITLQSFGNTLIPRSGSTIQAAYNTEEARAGFAAALLDWLPPLFYHRSVAFIEAQNGNEALYTTSYLCGDVNLNLTQLVPNAQTMPLAEAYADYEAVTVRGIQQGYLLEEGFRGGYGYHLAWEEGGYRFEIVIETNTPTTAPRAEVCTLSRDDVFSLAEELTIIEALEEGYESPKPLDSETMSEVPAEEIPLESGILKVRTYTAPEGGTVTLATMQIPSLTRERLLGGTIGMGDDGCVSLVNALGDPQPLILEEGAAVRFEGETTLIVDANDDTLFRVGDEVEGVGDTFLLFSDSEEPLTTPCTGPYLAFRTAEQETARRQAIEADVTERLFPLLEARYPDAFSAVEFRTTPEGGFDVVLISTTSETPEGIHELLRGLEYLKDIVIEYG